MAKIVISGTTGFIGSHLKDFLEDRGHEIVSISRHDFLEHASIKERIEGCDGVIHLAGYSIQNRWTEKNKHKMEESRVLTTKMLVETINDLTEKPSFFISTSGVSIYPDQGVHTEDAEDFSSTTFLGNLSQLWEHEARQVSEEVRLVILRLGVVMDTSGGMLQKLLKMAKKGFVFRFGSEDPPFAWIALEDLLSIYEYVINQEKIVGPVNAVAPASDHLDDIFRDLTNSYPEAVSIKIPSTLLRVVVGQGSELFFHGQRVVPDKLLRMGYTFKQKDLNNLECFRRRPYFYR